MRRLSLLVCTLVLALTSLTAALVVTVPSASASSAPTGSGAFSTTQTVIRENLVASSSGPTEQVVDQRTVTLNVSQTTNLRGRQEIQVGWTGAHPTGGIVADPNSIGAQQEEYPMVLLECRGTGATVTPETCWTQSWSERYQDSYQTQYPAYRMDQFASSADREQVVGAPSPLPAACSFLVAPTQHWIPFVAANGTTYAGGPQACAGEAPESTDVASSSQVPSNETYAATGTDGSGSANFDVDTSAENASLGCSSSTPCSLVAIPIMGVSCDPNDLIGPSSAAPPASELAQVTSSCEATGNFAPGSTDSNPLNQEALSVSGSLWWTASNWRNRITVPLSFAVPSSACSVVSDANALELYGSQLMVQATSQWSPSFCLNPSLFPLTHVQAGEPEARNLVAAGTASAALTSDAQPGGYGKPVANAPVAVTGFAISYVIDGANGQPYTSLKLTPLLLAKLLTESYPAETFIKQEDPALANNPLNITEDPEFIALNPGVGQVSATEAASELVSLSSDSDVIEALTSYINADPTARAWLNGTPDKWGMVVNPAYKGITLPVDSWPLLSTFEPKQYYATDNNDCLFHSPVPYLPLVSAPFQSLEDISESLQFSIANSTVACSQIDGTSTGEKLVPLGRQTTGHRFLIGLTPLADASRYLLSTASLETTPGNFVAPSNDTLEGAAKLLYFDPQSDTWPIPYSTIMTSTAANDAYPGTMVVYTASPTSGLSSTTASELATFLRFAVSQGQTPGLDDGDLPPGYLPITAADGLSPFIEYTNQAAADVAAQNGQIPGVTTPGDFNIDQSGLDPFTTSSFATSAPTSSSASKGALSSSLIPVLLSLEARTLHVNLSALGAAGVVLLAIVLMFTVLALVGIRKGRKRDLW